MSENINVLIINWKRKQKVIQYVAGRGFEFGVINEAFFNAQL